MMPTSPITITTVAIISSTSEKPASLQRVAGCPRAVDSLVVDSLGMLDLERGVCGGLFGVRGSRGRSALPQVFHQPVQLVGDIGQRVALAQLDARVEIAGADLQQRALDPHRGADDAI